jgi:hypothetical protein
MYHHRPHILGHRDHHLGDEYDLLRYTAHRLPQVGQLARAVRNQSTQGFQQSYQTGYHDNTGFAYSKYHMTDADVSRDADNERHRMLCFARFQRGRQRSVCMCERERVENFGNDEDPELSQE